MKKSNKPLRAAGILLLATMLTTSMTAGTFAKYTTSAESEDNARVAKFGVTVTADGTLYGQQYQDATGGNGIMTYKETDTTGTVQVSTSNDGNVVAPGTKNETGLGFSVNGKPEVDVNVASTITTDNIYLKAGSYGVMVEAHGITSVNFADSGDLYTVDKNNVYTKATAFADNTIYYKLHDAVTLTEDYYPVIYTLSGDTSYENDNKDTSVNTLAKIEEALEAELPTTADYNANTNLANELSLGSEVLTWEWAFSQNDGADTILGDLAAKGDDATFLGTVVKLDATIGNYSAPTEDEDYNLDTEFGISITVTQID